MKYNATDVGNCIKGLVSDLGLQYPHALQEGYELGLYPHLLSYEKVETSNPAIPAIQKYIIGASSFLHQPCHYYDIFRACRHVTLIQPLSKAIRKLIEQKVKGHEQKIEALRTTIDYDEFESLMFEVVAAWRYLNSEPVSHVEFIPQTPHHRTPDLFIVLDDFIETFCECKKLDRTSDYAVKLRNDVRDKLNPVITMLRQEGLSFVGEIAFLDDPGCIAVSRIANSCRTAIHNGVPIIEKDFRISAKQLPPYTSDTYKLYPSPDYYWGRYRFRSRSEWFGIVHQIFAKYTDHIGPNNDSVHGMSSWLKDVSWDAAIKWKIESPQLIAKYRRFSFDTVFSGLQQIDRKAIETILHVWIETEYCVGNRRDSMLDLFSRIKTNQKDYFGWLILNDLYFDVSPKGFFDLIEHAHMIQGPLHISEHPPISAVFNEMVSQDGSLGEFGVGLRLPDIDD